MFAIIFESVGAGEWLVLLAVVLVVVGPKRLPETARKVGNYYAKFRRAAESFKRQLMEMDTEINKTIDEAQQEAEKAMEKAAEAAYQVVDDEAKPDAAAESAGSPDASGNADYPQD